VNKKEKLLQYITSFEEISKKKKGELHDLIEFYVISLLSETLNFTEKANLELEEMKE
jgi:hypothetical protein